MKTKLDLKRLREVMKKYPLASAAVIGALALVAGLQVYQQIGHLSGPAAVAPPARPSPAPGPAPAPGTPKPPATVPGAPGAAPKPPAPGGAAPGGPATPVVPPGPVTGIQGPAGRVDPFAPLVSPGGGGGQPPLPPIPVLGPGGVPIPGGPIPPGLAAEGGLRVAGIIWNRGAVAIMVDGRGSYVVTPGDEISPGMRVVRIDVGRRVVEVQRGGGMQQLTLQGVGGAGQ
jgi:hypothetical protein